MFVSWNDYFTDEGKEFLFKIVELSLLEDGSEMTANGIFNPDDVFSAIIISKEDTLVVGLPIIDVVFSRMGVNYKCNHFVKEGDFVDSMTEVAEIKANACDILKAERIILNFICHLSGIANLTKQYVNQLEGTGVELLDTRKTIPGLRWVEKYAVQVGGGKNHRKNLCEMLMLKDNHIDAAGSIGDAVKLLRTKYRPCPPIEVECRTLDDVEAALKANVERIMLDNMDSAMLRQALLLIPENIEAEISGGVTLQTIRKIALTGPRRPDFISVGRLTHSSIAADFSMIIKK